MLSYTSGSPANEYCVLVSLLPSSTSCTPKLERSTLCACIVHQKRFITSGEDMESSCGRFFTSCVVRLAWNVSAAMLADTLSWLTTSR